MAEIRKIMKDAQLGKEETTSLLTDRYIPFKPSEEKILDARRKKNIFVPRGEINIQRALRRGMSLREEQQEEIDEVTSLFNIGGQLPVRVPEPPLTNTPQINVPSFDAVPNITQTASIQSNAATRTNPSFLGSSPDDILKNLDIARRTG